MIPRRRPAIDLAWKDYQEAHDKLAKMRVDTEATDEERAEQMEKNERLLQEWIELTANFKGTLD
tara:strand:+ start:248 stop:439 length:192 start_codon:yes stop_codon:yes gene_type:complete